jgi:phosphoribosylformimino-5-aminoimidazole carboxamide ribotide isomerase
MLSCGQRTRQAGRESLMSGRLTIGSRAVMVSSGKSRQFQNQPAARARNKSTLEFPMLFRALRFGFPVLKLPSNNSVSGMGIMEILPAIDLRNGKCVRLRQGDYSQETVFSEDPVEMAMHWMSDGAEWLHLVDLDGAKAGKPVNHEVVRGIVQATGVKCELGGGIRDEAAIRRMLEDVRVERVIIGTQALKQPEWFREMAAKWPGRLVLGIDARDGMVATEGWLEVSKTSAIELAKSYTDLDLAAVIYTNIANDGMMQGVDEGTIRDLIALSELGLPVIASGGVTTLDDVRRLAAVSREHPKLIGAIIGRAIYEGTIQVSAAIQAAAGSGQQAVGSG